MLGAVLGFEREIRQKAAGLRTHMLVCLASALLMLVSGYSFPDLGAGPRDPAMFTEEMGPKVLPSTGYAKDVYEIEGFVWRPPAEGPLDRKIFTAVRRGTAERPALQAVREALAEQARLLGLETSPQ